MNNEFKIFGISANTQEQVEQGLSLFPEDNPPNIIGVRAGIGAETLHYIKSKGIKVVLLFGGALFTDWDTTQGHNPNCALYGLDVSPSNPEIFQNSKVLMKGLVPTDSGHTPVWKHLIMQLFGSDPIYSDEEFVAYIAVHDEMNIACISNEEHEEVVSFLREIGINTPIVGIYEYGKNTPGLPKENGEIIYPDSLDLLALTNYDDCSPIAPRKNCNSDEKFIERILEAISTGLKYVLNINGTYEEWRNSNTWFPVSEFNNRYQSFYSQMWTNFAALALLDEKCVGMTIWGLQEPNFGVFANMPKLHGAIQMLNCLRDAPLLVEYENTFDSGGTSEPPAEELSLEVVQTFQHGFYKINISGASPIELIELKYRLDSTGQVDCNSNTPIRVEADLNGEVEYGPLPINLEPSTIRAFADNCQKKSNIVHWPLEGI